ncbi:MAG: hypothetical protein ACE5HC_12750 [Candidatus Binatia bacterium]
MRLPEFYLLMYAFLLNLLWEAVQAPLFVFEQQASQFLLGGCLLFCSLVDGLMTLTAYWVLSAIYRDRYWFVIRKVKYLWSFVGVALVLAVGSEYTAVHYRNLWEYSSLMPVIPVVQLGLTPVLQWLFLPPLVVIFMRRGFGSPTL